MRELYQKWEKVVRIMYNIRSIMGNIERGTGFNAEAGSDLERAMVLADYTVPQNSDHLLRYEIWTKISKEFTHRSLRLM